MENLDKMETNPNPESHTRILTSQEILEMNLLANLQETDFPKLLENNPDLTVETAQTASGKPLEIKIIQNGVVLFYDNLEAIERLKIQYSKPKNTIH